MPIELGGWELPAGANIAPSIYLIHRRPDIYPEPLEFRPERFLDDPPGTYEWIPFGGGVRRCLGASFAAFEMKVVIRAVLRSKAVLGLGVVVAVAVPALTLPRLPQVSIWPVVLGLLPWVAAKYLLYPLRWRALTDAGLSRWWHVRASAEAELLGLFTPGNIGADVWRVRRLTHRGLARGDAITSVGMDRLVGAIGLAVFGARTHPSIEATANRVRASFTLPLTHGHLTETFRKWPPKYTRVPSTDRSTVCTFPPVLTLNKTLPKSSCTSKP